jgi:hypothetical protein
MMEIFLPKMTEQMNEKLLAPFSADDVRKAMLSIGDYKAPGPTRMAFMQSFTKKIGTFVVMKLHRRCFKQLIRG